MREASADANLLLSELRIGIWRCLPTFNGLPQSITSRSAQPPVAVDGECCARWRPIGGGRVPGGDLVTLSIRIVDVAIGGLVGVPIGELVATARFPAGTEARGGGAGRY